MNRPTPNDRMDEEEIRGWIAEAGDCRVETRPEHVDRVRNVLLEHAVLPREPVIALDETESAPLGIGLIRLFGLACVVAAALFGAVHLSSRPTDGWASIAQALHDQPWIHIVTSGPEGLDEESWISPRFELLARKRHRGAELWDVEFDDIQRGVKEEYIAEENKIYRDMNDHGRRNRQAQELEIFGQLLQVESFKTSPIPDMELIAESHRDVIERGKTWKVYELTLRGVVGKKFDVKMSIQVDPKTGLPQTWNIEAEDGTLQMTFDYPATGPADLLALGVPATAKRDSSPPEESLDQVLNGLRVGRTRFDDYCAYVWTESATAADLRRVWRKGQKWRVENTLPRSTTKGAMIRHDPIPIDIDLAGLKQRENELVFEPEAVFDGITLSYYPYKPKATDPGQPSVVERKQIRSQQIYGMPDDPNNPWPDMLPELLGHPDVAGPTRFSARLWEYALDTKPNDGPSSTLRLHARHPPDHGLFDNYRIWIDPEKNYLALQAEFRVNEPAARSERNRVVYVDTKILTELGRSPNGFWYPTRVLRKSSKNQGDQVTRFLLDFQAAIPDALFEPIK
jgi:hypothetical protein